MFQAVQSIKLQYSCGGKIMCYITSPFDWTSQFGAVPKDSQEKEQEEEQGSTFWFLSTMQQETGFSVRSSWLATYSQDLPGWPQPARDSTTRVGQFQAFCKFVGHTFSCVLFPSFSLIYWQFCAENYPTAIGKDTKFFTDFFLIDYNTIYCACFHPK